jgi:hypothetical protein
MSRRTTPLTCSVLALSCLAFAACSSDAKSPAATSTTAALATSTTTSTTAAVDEAATTSAPATPASLATDGSAVITVAVGTDDFATSKGTRVVSVPKGTAVTIELTDAASDESYHLHGYDLESKVKKGETAKISFTADQTGQFDLESHTTNATLLVLVVV